MIVSIHQPNFLPWLGYVDKILRCDKFVLLDDVQLTRPSNTHRVNILLNSRVHMLSVPVRHAGTLNVAIRDAKLADDHRAFKKLCNTLEAAYQKTKHWNDFGRGIIQIIEARPTKLYDLNWLLLKHTLEYLHVDLSKIVLQSNVPAYGQKSELIANLTKSLGGTVYLSGGHTPKLEASNFGKTGTAADYNDEATFNKYGIELVYQNFQHPVYNQGTAEFFAGLSAVDSVCRLGRDVLRILK